MLLILPDTRFLSTPSSRRATFVADVVFRCLAKISIHALLAEGDASRRCMQILLPYFYPRPPRGGRHIAFNHFCQPLSFLSTPSSRRATLSFSFVPSGVLDFYPRPPRGGRRAVRTACALLFCKFLSTPSSRRATVTSPDSRLQIPISIHALLAEGDINLL